MKTINLKPNILINNEIHTFYAIDKIIVKGTILTGFTASYCN